MEAACGRVTAHHCGSRVWRTAPGRFPTPPCSRPSTDDKCSAGWDDREPFLQFCMIHRCRLLKKRIQDGASFAQVTDQFMSDSFLTEDFFHLAKVGMVKKAPERRRAWRTIKLRGLPNMSAGGPRSRPFGGKWRNFRGAGWPQGDAGHHAGESDCHNARAGQRSGDCPVGKRDAQRRA